MSTKSYIDDYTNFHYTWLSTSGDNSRVIDDKREIALGVKLTRTGDGQNSSLDLRKKFPAHFEQKDIKITFRMSVPEGIEIQTFRLKTFGGKDYIDISAPAADGKWHSVEAELTITESDRNELWISMFTAPTEQVLVGFNDIHIVQH